MYACDITSTDKQNVCFASLSIQSFLAQKLSLVWWDKLCSLYTVVQVLRLRKTKLHI